MNEQNIKQLIDNVLHENNKLNDGLAEVKIIAAWNSTVGMDVARQTDKLFVRNKILYVNVSNNTLRQELYYQRSKICYAINGILKKQLIKEIVLK